jgi:hypothetical protein
VDEFLFLHVMLTLCLSLKGCETIIELIPEVDEAFSSVF